MSGVKLVCLSCAQTNRVPSAKIGAGAKCGTCGASLFPSKAVEVDPATLAKASRIDELPIVADFWAPWCGPCRMMAPEFSKAAAAMQGRARLVKLNTQDHQEAGARHGIRGIPTMVVWSGGRERGRQSGALPAAQIQTFAERAIGPA